MFGLGFILLDSVFITYLRKIREMFIKYANGF